MDIAEVHAQALDATRVYVAGVREDQWSDSTPCEDWDVRTLVNHLVTGNEWAAELAAGTTIAEFGDRIGRGELVPGMPATTHAYAKIVLDAFVTALATAEVRAALSAAS